LEAVEVFSGERIAGRDGTTGAGIAALEIYFADFEADYAAFVFAEELVFPEGGDAVDFQCGAEALAGFVECDAGETLGQRGKPFVPQGKPLGDGLQRGGGDDGGAACNGIVGKTVFGVADDDLLIEEDAEPFGGVIVGFGEGEGARGISRRSPGTERVTSRRSGE